MDNPEQSVDELVRQLQDIFPAQNSDDYYRQLLVKNNNDLNAVIDSIYGSSNQSTTNEIDVSSLRSDHEAFQALKTQYQELLDRRTIHDVWKRVRKEYELSKLDERYVLATNLLNEEVERKFCDDCKDTVIIATSEADQFTEYMESFQDLLPNDKLLQIWNSSKADEGDSRYKLTRLESAAICTINLLSQKMINQPSQQRNQTLPIMNKKKKSRPSTLSAKDAAILYVYDLFNGNQEYSENPLNKPIITKEHIEELLFIGNYDIDEVISKIFQEIRTANSFIIENKTFAMAIQSNRSNDRVLETSSNYSTKSNPPQKAKNSNNQSEKCTKVNNQEKATLPSPSSYSDTIFQPTLASVEDSWQTVSYQRNKPHKTGSSINQDTIANHFLRISRQYNPALNISLDDRNQLMYNGRKDTNGNYSMRVSDKNIHSNVMTVRLDLHGLIIDYALQLVDSCIDYYAQWNLTHSGNHERYRQIMFIFVVGKGIHSQRGKARLAPVIQKYCHEEIMSHHLDDCLLSDGQIFLKLNYY